MELAVQVLLFAGVIHLFRKSLGTAERLPEWDQVLSRVWMAGILLVIIAEIFHLRFIKDWYSNLIYVILFVTVYLLRDYRPARTYMIALMPYAVVYVADRLVELIAPSFFVEYRDIFHTGESFAVIWLISFGIYAATQNQKERKIRHKEEEQIRVSEARKAELEHLVVERTAALTRQKEELELALRDLKAAQVQLVQSEKMASLGELTAGIAHEIQNPLNFVTNFAELSVELAQELLEEVEKPQPDKALIGDLVKDLSENQEKINRHGKRAASIVTGMLQHARTSTGKKEPIEVNPLVEEYLRLSFHGLRAKNKEFQAKMITHLDPEVGQVELIPQDFGRVLLNLINNAFYAVTQRKKQEPEGYVPTVTVSTERTEHGVKIRIQDN
ncbi:MAG: histidine kinase dimerization/phospho-acceptor domain-containing protein, partial [Saprospiraceae bacterium]